MPVVAGKVETRQTSCDTKALTEAKAEFQRLKDSRKRGNKANGEEFRAASKELILLSEDCYIAKHGSLGDGQIIDHGGLRVSGGGIQPRHNLFGTKWGSGSPFLPLGDNLDAVGPRLPGGEITYSFMADGVSIGDDGGSGVSCSPTCVNTSLFGFTVSDSDGDTFFPRCLVEEIEIAFGAWASVADITFTEVTDNGVAFNAAGATGDIRIGFHPFDGVSGLLAHGFFPPPNGVSAAGDIHFDLDDSWDCMNLNDRFDIGIVALHEIGHAIGLGHEPGPGGGDLAIMNAFHNPALNFGPLADDIIGAGEIYGEAGAATTAFFGDIGIGTDSPGASLHVTRDDGSAKVFVEEASATTANRNMFELRNNGAPQFTLINTGLGVTWQFSQDAAGNFQFNRTGTGGAELLLRPDGRLRVGPGPDIVFDLAPNGDLTIDGALTELSDRDAKESIAQIDPLDILDKVSGLEISTWRYKGRVPSHRHIGPMAQDFHAAFGVGGDARHIAPLDTSGVALAAIQGLNSENARLRGQLSEQQMEIDSLKRELAELRALVESAARR